MDRATIRGRKKFSLGYLRFRRQLTALHEGKTRMVRKIAREAREELLAKRTNQMTLLHSSLH